MDDAAAPGPAPAPPARTSEQAGPPLWRLLLPGLALVALGVVGFLSLLDAVLEQDDLWLVDEPLLEALVAARTPGWTTFFTVVTTLFGPVVLTVLVAVGCAVWAWRSRTWWEPVVLAGAMLTAALLSALLKLVVGRPRPPGETMVVPGLETTFSFPSGHTIGAATLVLVGGYLVHHRHRSGVVLVVWGLVSVVVVALVAVSRLYLGYHFLTDVLAGVCVAVVVLGGVVVLERLHDRRLERRSTAGEGGPLPRS